MSNALNETAAPAMFVVEKACKFSPDGTSGVITIESTNDREFNLAIEGLRHADARHMATGYAITRGVSDARVNGNLIGPYPINSKGAPLDMVKDEGGNSLPPAHPDMQPAAYRVDVPVCRRLV